MTARREHLEHLSFPLSNYRFLHFVAVVKEKIIMRSIVLSVKTDGINGHQIIFCYDNLQFHLSKTSKHWLTRPSVPSSANLKQSSYYNLHTAEKRNTKTCFQVKS